MKLGIICRADKTGLANQTRNLVKMLEPDRILIIDSTPFNGNQQYFGMYKDYESIISNGFPTDETVRKFLYKLDYVITCETFYNNNFIAIARQMGVKTYNQFNYEFLDNLSNPNLPLPDNLISPSYWHLEGVKLRYPNVTYLPPPIDEEKFEKIKQINLLRNSMKPRFLHVVGRMAANDRNGTIDLLESLKFTKKDFELVVSIQTSYEEFKKYNDKRITFDTSCPDNEEELYSNFDAMILPRKYAGLCLPMNEALSSGLPVIMTDVSPNNQVLPKDWLVESYKSGEMQTRVKIPLYSANKYKLAEKIDDFCNKDIREEKLKAELISNFYSMKFLKYKYKTILNIN